MFALDVMRRKSCRIRPRSFSARRRAVLQRPHAREELRVLLVGEPQFLLRLHDDIGVEQALDLRGRHAVGAGRARPGPGGGISSPFCPGRFCRACADAIGRDAEHGRQHAKDG